MDFEHGTSDAMTNRMHQQSLPTLIAKANGELFMTRFIFKKRHLSAVFGKIILNVTLIEFSQTGHFLQA
jgi:hypothetical protein